MAPSVLFNRVAECSNCQYQDGAVPKANLRTPYTNGVRSMVTDSVDPVWTGSASNVGKPVTAGGNISGSCALGCSGSSMGYCGITVKVTTNKLVYQA